MKTANRSNVTLVALLLLTGCATLPKEIAVPARGTLELSVSPNPILAEHVSTNVYDFPFDIVMRETGGVDVTIEGFTVDITLANVVHLFTQTFPPAEITRRGYPAAVPAGQFLRFSFRKRKEVPTELVFHAATARVSVTTVDRYGFRGTAELKIAVRR